MSKVFIIAEAGVNHNGSIELAKCLVDSAAEAGADTVKFQTFRAEKMTSKFAPKAAYQEETTSGSESQLDMLKKLELDSNAHVEIIEYCRKKSIMFLSAPFDIESVDLLDKLGLEMFKIPSGGVTDLPYLERIGSLGKKVIMSTGMADLKEIEEALDVLTRSGTSKEDITILHCNTEYPTPVEDTNLAAMLTMKKVFKANVGYSDHTTGTEVPIAAVALGASMIEKHFTLDKGMEGPDHRMSLEPHEFKSMVEAIRNIEKALGDGRKKPSKSEAGNRRIVRKSIVAGRDIKKGEIFTEENITAKRPGSGISPMRWHDVIGKVAKRDFRKDEVLTL